jgi:hypothetical protein
LNQLQAMKDQNVRISRVDCEDELVYFPNGVVLPIVGIWSPDRSHELDEPEDGAWIEFGNDEIGYGWYPCKMITEEEYRAEQEQVAGQALRRGCA